MHDELGPIWRPGYGKCDDAGDISLRSFYLVLCITRNDGREEYGRFLVWEGLLLPGYPRSPIRSRVGYAFSRPRRLVPETWGGASARS